MVMVALCEKTTLVLFMSHLLISSIKSVPADSITNLEFPPRYFLPSDWNLITYVLHPHLNVGNQNQWVIRTSVVVVGLIGTSLAHLLMFWILGAETAYMVIFPQLICVLFFYVSNGYGAVIGLLVGLVLKLLS